MRSSNNLKDEVDISTVVDNVDCVDKDMVAAFRKDDEATGPRSTSRMFASCFRGKVEPLRLCIG